MYIYGGIYCAENKWKSYIDWSTKDRLQKKNTKQTSSVFKQNNKILNVFYILNNQKIRTYIIK